MTRGGGHLYEERAGIRVLSLYGRVRFLEAAEGAAETGCLNVHGDIITLHVINRNQPSNKGIGSLLPRTAKRWQALPSTLFLFPYSEG